jgi:hypothetical protein
MPPINKQFDSGERSVGGPRYMQTLATLTNTDVDIKTHLLSHIKLGGFHGLVTVTLADNAGKALWVSQPYLDGVGSQLLNPSGRWVEHHEQVPEGVATYTDRIDILQCWHGVNTLEKFLADLFVATAKKIGDVIVEWLKQLLGGNPGVLSSPPIDTTLGQLANAMTSTGGPTQRFTRAGFYHGEKLLKKMIPATEPSTIKYGQDYSLVIAAKDGASGKPVTGRVFERYGNGPRTELGGTGVAMKGKMLGITKTERQGHYDPELHRVVYETVRVTVAPTFSVHADGYEDADAGLRITDIPGPIEPDALVKAAGPQEPAVAG